MPLKQALSLFLVLASAPSASVLAATWGDPFGPQNTRPGGDDYSRSWGQEQAPPVRGQGRQPSTGRPAAPPHFGYSSGSGSSDPRGYGWSGEPYDRDPYLSAPDYSAGFRDGTYRPVEPPGPGSADYRDSGFRPPGPRWDGPDDAMGPGFDSADFPDASPGYRFRGDPPAGRAGWQSGSRDAAYRFRPLDAQELGRMDRGPSYRPIERRGDESRKAPAATPGEAYGFEPAPWRSR